MNPIQTAVRTFFLLKTGIAFSLLIANGANTMPRIWLLRHIWQIRLFIGAKEMAALKIIEAGVN